MNLGVEIVVAGIDDPASPYGHAIAMLRTEARRNQFMISSTPSILLTCIPNSLCAISFAPS